MKFIFIAACLFMSIAVIPESLYAESVSRCNEALIKDGDLILFKEGMEKLRNDPFSEALGIYIRDLEGLERLQQDIVHKWNNFQTSKCRPHNAEADECETAIRNFNSSHCAGTVSKEEYPACMARKGELDTWRTRILNRYEILLREWEQLAKELQDLNAKSAGPLRNAENILNRDNTEQVLRLYIWNILDQKQKGAINSCQAFAKIADKLGKRVAHQSDFINFLSRNVIEPRGDVNFLSGDPPFRPMAGSTFDATGFKKHFYGDITENQVRHAANYLLIGYKLTGGASAVVSFSQDVARRHPEMWDYYLAVHAGQLGFRLRTGVYKTPYFGEAMRKEFCE